MASVNRSVQYKAISAVLDAEGVNYKVEWGGKHPKMVFAINGREIKYTISASPSCNKAGKNAASDVKRIIRQAQSA